MKKRSSEEISCPICGYLIDLPYADTHVNQCLDNNFNEPIRTPSTDQTTIENKELASPSNETYIKLIELDESNEEFTKSIEVLESNEESNKIIEILESNHTQKVSLNTISSNDTLIQSKDTPISNQRPTRKKPIPEYKWIYKTQYVVDAFLYGDIPNCKGYFLSHFHADHYGGLTSKFTHGPIICSQITANLVLSQLKVDEEYLYPLPMNTVTRIGNMNVTLLEANHCPGAVLFLFEYQIDSKTTRVLHTGDFRAHSMHLEMPDIINNPIDIIYLDTTYLSPSHCFPSQESILSLVTDLFSRIKSGSNIKDLLLGKSSYKIKSNGQKVPCKNPKLVLKNWLFNIKPRIDECKKPSTLIFVGSYSVGKEKIYLSIAKSFGSKIHVDPKRFKMLNLLEWPELSCLLTTDPNDANVFVCPMGRLKPEYLKKKLGLLNSNLVKEIICVSPTGWSFRPSKKEFNKQELFCEDDIRPTYSSLITDQNKCIPITTIGIPYSEHSSFLELKMFLKGLKWFPRIIPTVNVSKYEEMNRWFEEWKLKENEMK